MGDKVSDVVNRDFDNMIADLELERALAIARTSLVFATPTLFSKVCVELSQTEIQVPMVMAKKRKPKGYK